MTINPAAISRCASVAVRGRAPVAPNQRAARRHPTVDFDQVLESDRDPVQRPDRVPRSDRLVGRLGGEPRILGINLDKGMQLGVRRADPGQRSIDEIDGREPTSAYLDGKNTGRQQRRIGFG